MGSIHLKLTLASWLQCRFISYFETPTLLCDFIGIFVDETASFLVLYNVHRAPNTAPRMDRLCLAPRSLSALKCAPMNEINSKN